MRFLGQTTLRVVVAANQHYLTKARLVFFNRNAKALFAILLLISYLISTRHWMWHFLFDEFLYLLCLS